MDIPFDFPAPCLGGYQHGTIWRAAQDHACPAISAAHSAPASNTRSFLHAERDAMVLQGLSDLGEGVILSDGDKIIYANEALCVLSGHSLDELLAFPSLNDLVAPAYQPASAERVRHLANGEQIGHFESALRHKSGRIVPLDISTKVSVLGGKVQIISVVRDITSRKEAEARLQALNDELEQQLEERAAEIIIANNIFVALLNSTPDLMFRLRRDGVFLDVYAGHEEDLLVMPEETIGQSIHTLLPPPLAATVQPLIEQAIDADSIQVFEYTLPVPRGLREYEARIAKCNSDEVLLLVRDVTERKRAERELRISEARTRAMLAAIPDTIVRFAHDGTIIDFKSSQVASELPLDALQVGKPIGAILPIDSALLKNIRALKPGDPPLGAEYTLPQHFDEYLLARQVITHEQFARARMLQVASRQTENHLFLGEAFVLEGVLSSEQCDELLAQWERGRSFRNVEIRIGATGSDSIVMVLRDITERKRAEQQTEALNRVLQRSRDLLRTLLDSLQDGLLLLDAQGRVLALNHRFAELLEDRTSDVVGLHWMEFSETTQFLPFSWEEAHTSLHEGQPQHRRKRYTLPDNAVRILDIALLPIANGENDAEQLIVHVVDVSERLQLEAQVLEQERFAASARLAATVAHEVNSPLQAVESCLHIAERANEKRRAEYLQIAREEVIRVGQILRQLLDVFQPALPRRAPVDINELIERVLLLMGSTLARQDVAVEFDALRSLPLVWCHGDEITQVLINLMMNAGQAMPHGGQLQLRTRFRPAPDEISIEISDTGQGMSKELQARIFEPFFTTKSDGTGMGLAVCQKLVQRHQGSLAVQSVLDAGTTFTIRLPVGSATNS